MKKQKNKNLVSRVLSEFKKLIAVGTLTASALITSSGCVTEDEIEAKLHKDIACLLSSYGRRKMSEGDLEKGIMYLKEASNIEPNFFDSFLIGNYYREKKRDIINAEKYLRMALSLGKEAEEKLEDEELQKLHEIMADVNFEMGVLLYEKEDYDKASLYFDKAIKINPKKTDARLYFAKCVLKYCDQLNDKRQKAKKYNDAARCLKKVERKDADYYYLFGSILSQLGDLRRWRGTKIKTYKNAVSYLEKAVKLRENEENVSLLNATKSKLEEERNLRLEQKNREEEKFIRNLPIQGWYLTFGQGGESDAYSSGFEVNNINKFNQLLFGCGASGCSSEGRLYETNPSYSLSDEVEIYVVAGKRFKFKHDLFLVGTIGISDQTINDEFGNVIDEISYTTWSINLKYFHNKFTCGLGYHNRRGAVVAIGILNKCF